MKIIQEWVQPILESEETYTIEYRQDGDKWIITVTDSHDNELENVTCDSIQDRDQELHYLMKDYNTENVHPLTESKKRQFRGYKKNERGWFQTMGGDPKKNVEIFNKNTTFNEPQAAPGVSGGDSADGAAAASGGAMGESLDESLFTETYMDRDSMIAEMEKLGYHYDWHKYKSNKQLAAIYNRIINSKKPATKQATDTGYTTKVPNGAVKVGTWKGHDIYKYKEYYWHDGESADTYREAKEDIDEAE